MSDWLTRTALAWGARLYTWGAVRFLLAEPISDIHLDPLPVRDPDRAAALIDAELKVIPRQVRANICYHDAEVRLQTERLMRRYDLGAALNEAAQRAIADKAKPPPGYPTALQKKALDLQAETLRERIRNS